jgi:hypothetical protein
VPLPLLAGCTTDETAKVSVDGIVGTWTASGGEELVFSADRAFTSSDSPTTTSRRRAAR